VPNSIITDNGSQFTGRKFLEFCDKFHIRVDWAAVAHPQTNGQVERANGMILQGLKPRIFDQLNKSGRKWLQELPAVVWSLRTTPSRATGFTPALSSPWRGGRPPHGFRIWVAQSARLR
jgi:transposase InsO family protein